MINMIVAAVPVTTGDGRSDAVTVIAIIGLAVVLIINLILENLDQPAAGSRTSDGR